MPTQSSSSCATLSASSRGWRRTVSGPRVTFCSAVNIGKRLKLWNTIPLLRRWPAENCGRAQGNLLQRREQRKEIEALEHHPYFAPLPGDLGVRQLNKPVSRNQLETDLFAI